jgi:hypothetical protein
MIRHRVDDQRKPAHLREQSHGVRLAERVGTVVEEEKEEVQRTPSTRVRHVPAENQ